MAKNKNQIYWIIGVVIVLFLIFRQGQKIPDPSDLSTISQSHAGAVLPNSDISLSSLTGRTSDTVGNYICSDTPSFTYYGSYKKYFIPDSSTKCIKNSLYNGLIVMMYHAIPNWYGIGKLKLLNGESDCFNNLIIGDQYEITYYKCTEEMDTCKVILTGGAAYYTDGCCDTTHIKRTRKLQELSSGGCSDYCSSYPSGATNKGCTTSGSYKYHSICYPDDGTIEPKGFCGGGQIVCLDSDSGVYSPTKGTATKGTDSKIDYCPEEGGITLREYACKNGNIEAFDLDCSEKQDYICKDGACVLSSSAKCTSDEIKICADGTSVITKQCISGQLTDTGKTCTGGTGDSCTTDELLTCTDGTSYPIRKCVNGKFGDYETPTPVCPGDKSTASYFTIESTGDLIRGGKEVKSGTTSAYRFTAFNNDKQNTRSAFVEMGFYKKDSTYAQDLIKSAGPNVMQALIILPQADNCKPTEDFIQTARLTLEPGGEATYTLSPKVPNELFATDYIVSIGFYDKCYKEGDTQSGLQFNAVRTIKVNPAMVVPTKETECTNEIDDDQDGKMDADDSDCQAQPGGECTDDQFEYNGLCIDKKIAISLSDLATYELPYEEKSIWEGIKSIGCFSLAVGLTAGEIAAAPVTAGASLPIGVTLSAAAGPFCGSLFKADPYTVVYLNTETPICKHNDECVSGSCIKSSKSDRATAEKTQIYEIFKDWERVRTTPLGKAWNWAVGLFSEDDILNYGLCVETEAPFNLFEWMEKNIGIPKAYGIWVLIGAGVLLLLIMIMPQKRA